MLRNLFVSILFLLLNFHVGVAQHGVKYWVTFKHKGLSPYSLSNPSEFLSQQAIDRRLKYNIALDSSDLPVAQYFLDSIKKFGVHIMYSSKWFNAATIEAFDTSVIKQIRKVSFVTNIQKTADAESYTKISKNHKFEQQTVQIATPQANSYYGYGNVAITMLNGQFLHNLGFRGKGVQIAVIDAGFQNAQSFSTLDSARNENRILGTNNFVDRGKTVYLPEPHGAEVLSLIGALQPSTMVGTAPDASFWLLVSEDINSENPVEEDNWVAAIEYADSVGVDVTNTSLGYTTFDDPVFSRTFKNMNGATARNSIAAEIAVNKGIAVVVAAGNEGDNSWHYIGTPADAKNILAVGSVNGNKQRSLFSSFGPTSDGRIKPDIMAKGEYVTTQNSATGFTFGSGTSFAAPEITGLIACLIQAFPTSKVSDVFTAVKMSSTVYYSPNDSIGYGIPDFQKAYTFLKNNNVINGKNNIAVFPNPCKNYLVVNADTLIKNNLIIECYGVSGIKMFSTQKQISQYIFLHNEIQYLPQGIYILKCSSGSKKWTIKIEKQ